MYTNVTTGNPFYIVWSNVVAGSYTLKAVATDTAGIMATSVPISITVILAAAAGGASRRSTSTFADESFRYSLLRPM